MFTQTRKTFFTGLLLLLTLAACGDSAPNTPASASLPTVAIPAAASSPAAPTATRTADNPTTQLTKAPAPAATQTKPATEASSTEPIQLRFSEFYASKSSPINLVFSDKLNGANGKLIKITGYMAPPLKPNLDFFVLTRIKLAVCPFCSTAADWPEDILLVTMNKGKTVKQIEEPITVIGKLEISDAVDPQTGFFSLLRLRGESVEVFKGS